MRHFAADLVEEGFNVEYLKIEDKKNSGILELELEQVGTKNRMRECHH